MSGPGARPTRVFIATPSDLIQERERAARVVEALAEEATDREPFVPYRWEAEQDRAWDAGKGWQTQIPRPSREDCEVLVCVLGERIGSPLPDTDPLPADFEVPDGIVFPGVDEDELFGEGDVSGPIPLTGTLFEYFDARQAQRRTGRPHILLFLKGDRSVEAVGAPADERRWGLGAFLKECESRSASGRLKRNEAWEYDLQTTFLSRFFDRFLGNAATWQRFADVDEFERLLTVSLRDVLGLKPPEWRGNPYKRLERYEIGEAEILRGRAHDVRQMVDRLAAADAEREAGRIPLLIVEGDSGVGKSSTLRAGLAARLKDGRDRSRTRARFVPLVVAPADLQGDEPLLALMERAAKDVLSELGDGIAVDLRRVFPEHRVDAVALRIRDALEERRRSMAAEAGGRPAEPVKLFLAIDQFEEVLQLRACGEGDAWTPVLRLLVQLCSTGLAYAAVGLKTDRLGELNRWLQSENLPNRNAFPGWALYRPEPDAVIQEPFARCGLKVHPDLHDHLKVQWKRYEESLPLLSVTLSNLYDAWEARCRLQEALQLQNPLVPQPPVPRLLTLADYEPAASLTGAIDRLGRAAFEAASAALKEHTAELVARVLRRLVDVPPNGAAHPGVAPGTEGELGPDVTLRTCPEAEIPEAAGPLLAALKRNRLVLEEDGNVRLVHEAVLYHWDQARAWLENERSHLKTRSGVRSQLQWWLEDPSDANPPLANQQIDNAERMLVDWRDEVLEPELRAFVTAAIRRRVADGSHARADGTPRLADAVRLRDEALVTFMLDHGADRDSATPVVTETDADGRASRTGGSTALMFAAHEGSERLVRLLIGRGADVRRENAQRSTALDYAASEGHVEILRVLHEEHGAAVDHPDQSAPTALWWAALNGHADVVRRLLAYEAAIDRPDAAGFTPLIMAAQHGHMEVMELLIEGGATVSAASARGWTALTAAAEAGHRDAARLLLEHRGPVDQENADGSTALLVAARSGEAEVIRLLLGPAHGADPNHRDRNGRTALHLAAANGGEDAVAALLEAAATDPSPYDNLGRSPLYLALQGDHGGVVSRLVAARACVPPWFAGGAAEWRRLRGPELRRHLARMLTASAEGAGSGWALAPLLDGEWTVLDPAAGAELLAAAVDAAPAGLGCGIERVDAVRVRPLPFYGDAQLCEARARRGAGAVGYLTFVRHPGGATWLDGTSSPIHRLNAERPLRLAGPAEALDYLRFFCQALQARPAGDPTFDEYAFVLIESPARLAWPESVSREAREKAGAHANGLRHLSDAKGGPWNVSGVVQFGDLLSDAEFSVETFGMVTMVRDRPRAFNLELHAEGFRDDVRTRLTTRPGAVPVFNLDWTPDPPAMPGPIPPLVAGSWTPCEGEAVDRLLADVGRRLPARFQPGIDRLDAIWMRPLPFYPDGVLYEARAWRDDELAGYITFIQHRGGTAWLDGTVEPIRALNAALPPRLDDGAEALEYLRFFCAAVHGPRGSAAPLESVDRLVWPAGTPEEERRRAAAVVRPLTLAGSSVDPDGRPEWRATGAIRRGGEVLQAELRIGADGRVEILDTDGPIGRIGAHLEVFHEGFRTLRPLGESSPTTPLPSTA
ncbi:MAG TPA: ankyrin repeat domain-containing protein [Longimicrobiales bacterium]|nr:ankyrin repeat domain-containing protein [Longimicrobiales bacterium]